MNLTGKIKEVNYDYYTKLPVISFLINEEPDGIDELRDKDLSIKVTRCTKPRSLDSNAYFHVLCDKLRQKLGISMAHCKNELITSYGQIMYMDEEETQAFIYKTNATPEFIQEQEFMHMDLIKIGDDGAYWYRGYRGSHTYSSVEMNKLIEGTISECKLQGIETATPEQLVQMQQLWAQKIGEQNG